MIYVVPLILVVGTLSAKQETGNRKQETGNRKQETGSTSNHMKNG